jgi:hypothetical protein
MAATVGETRAWLEAAYGIPHADNTHFVIVTCSERGGLGITGCCDGTDEAGQLLAGALSALTGNATPAPASGSVIVSRDDLRLALANVNGFGFDLAPAVERLVSAAGTGCTCPDECDREHE